MNLESVNLKLFLFSISKVVVIWSVFALLNAAVSRIPSDSMYQFIVGTADARTFFGLISLALFPSLVASILFPSSGVYYGSLLLFFLIAFGFLIFLAGFTGVQLLFSRMTLAFLGYFVLFAFQLRASKFVFDFWSMPKVALAVGAVFVFAVVVFLGWSKNYPKVVTDVSRGVLAFLYSGDVSGRSGGWIPESALRLKEESVSEANALEQKVKEEELQRIGNE